MKWKRSTIAVWTIVATVFGGMISVQYHDVMLGGAALWSAQPDVASVAARWQAVNEINQQLREHLKVTEQATLQLQQTALHQGGTVAQMERQMHAAIVLTGDSPLVGPGITVTIDDGRMNAADQEQFLTHDWDLRSVINELFLAGADAVAINQARVTAQTGVFCIGPVVRVGGARLGPPFVLRAIGNPAVLAAALSMPGGVLDGLRGANRGLAVSKPTILRQVRLPAYAPPLLPGAGSGAL